MLRGRDPGRQGSQCKGPGAGTFLAFVRSSKLAHVAGGQWMRANEGASEARGADGYIGREAI